MNPGNINKPAFQLARVEEGEELYQQTEIIMIGDGASRAAAHTMSRRDFLGTTITAGAALAFLSGCGKPDDIIDFDDRISGVGEKSKTAVLGAHTREVNAVFITSDGKLLISGSADNTIKIWSLHERSLQKTLQEAKAKGIGVRTVVAGAMRNSGLDVAGEVIVSGDTDGIVKIWSMPGGDLIKTINTKSFYVGSVGMSPDGKLLVSGGMDRNVRLWGDDGEPKVLGGHENTVYSVCISPDGKLLASGGGDNIIKLWSLPDGALRKTLKGHTRGVYSLAISPDGKLLVSGAEDDRIRFWSLPDGKLIKSIKMRGYVHAVFITTLSICISPDGKWLITGDKSNEIKIWSLPDGALVKRLKGHTSNVNSVCMSPDGKLLASGSSDKTIRLWSFPDGEFISCLADLEANPAATTGAVYSVVSETGQTITYTLPCGAAIPAGATCACNCVPGSIKPPAPAKSTAPSSGSSGGGGCHHGTRCVCMAVRCRRT